MSKKKSKKLDKIPGADKSPTTPAVEKALKKAAKIAKERANVEKLEADTAETKKRGMKLASENLEVKPKSKKSKTLEQVQEEAVEAAAVLEPEPAAELTKAERKAAKKATKAAVEQLEIENDPSALEAIAEAEAEEDDAEAEEEEAPAPAPVKKPAATRTRKGKYDDLLVELQQAADTPNAKGKRKPQAIELTEDFSQKDYGDKIVSGVLGRLPELNLSAVTSPTAGGRYLVTITAEPTVE